MPAPVGRCFPCLPRSKQPAIKGGFHAATTNPATIQRYWRIADRNIGIPTGEAAGFWVLDVDGEAGEASLLLLEREHGPLPPTREVTTGNGRHVWFHCAAPIPSSAGRIGTRPRCSRRPRLHRLRRRASIRAGACIRGAPGTAPLAPAPHGWCALPAPSRCRPSPSVRWRPSGRVVEPTPPGCLRPRRAQCRGGGAGGGGARLAQPRA